VALILDADDGELCIGVLDGARTPEERADPTNSPTPFIHCWVEYGGKLFAPTTIEAVGGLYAFHPITYYQANGVRDIHRIPLERIKALATQHGWREYFTTGKNAPGYTPLGTIVLDECGIPWQISDRGGVIPTQTQETE
jgi:hypothetical protein